MELGRVKVGGKKWGVVTWAPNKVGSQSGAGARDARPVGPSGLFGEGGRRVEGIGSLEGW